MYTHAHARNNELDTHTHTHQKETLTDSKVHTPRSKVTYVFSSGSCPA